MTQPSFLSLPALASALIALALSSTAANTVAQSTPILESLLGAESFQAAGLHKLSESEQAALVRVLQAKGLDTVSEIGATAAVSNKDDEAEAALRARLEEAQRSREALAAEMAATLASAEDVRQERDAAIAAAKAAEAERDAAERTAMEATQDVIESRLQAPFTGWTGKTLMRLENGQLWRQRLPGRYLHREGDLPRVKLTKNVLGYYEMELLDHGRKIGVSRVRERPRK